MKRPSVDEVIEAAQGLQMVLKLGAIRLPVIVTRLERRPGTLISLEGLFRSDGIPFLKCDGNHAAPRCADPECWQQ